MVEQQRMKWVDVAKGIAIILMVAGHTTIPERLSNFIFAFHMPLFFIASGLCTNWDKYSFSVFAVKKIRTLGLPYLVYSILVILIAWLVGYSEIDLLSVLQHGWKGYALWFVPVLFFALLATKIILMLTKTWARVLGAFTCISSGVLLCYYKVSLPWTLFTVPFATFLVIVGNKLKPFCRFIAKPSKWMAIVGLFCMLVTIVVSGYWRLDLASNMILPVVPLTIGAITGTVMVFLLSSFIVNISFKPLSSALAKIGQETYIIMAFSQIIIVSMKLHTNWGSLARYICLILILIAIVVVKDQINRLAGKKLL